MAYCGKYIDKASYRIFCVIGDGESAEGSVWEACAFAGHYKLDNLVAIFDVNQLGQLRWYNCVIVPCQYSDWDQHWVVWTPVIWSPS